MSPLAAMASLGRLPRVRLAVLPTPLAPAPGLAAAVGLEELWIKRDDLTGFGAGGQKVRGLELLLGQARAERADVIVTGAGPQSNHVRATAAAAATLGIGCVVVLWGDPPLRAVGNLALSGLARADVMFTGSSDRTSVDRAIEAVTAELRAAGRRPYAIPRGGACALGAAAHVHAALELESQCRAAGICPEAVVLAAGSGGTLAGWHVGRQLAGAAWRLEAVSVSRPAGEVRAKAAALVTAVADLLGGGALPAEPGDFIVHDGFAGPGYGIPSDEGLAAIELAWRRAGLLLDPTYTGKAMAAVERLAKDRRLGLGGPVIFLHSGGAPALFALEGWPGRAIGRQA